PDDRTYIGDPIPNATMGLNINFNYKNFDFTTFASASLGSDMVRNYERNQPNVNRHAYWLERWTGPGTSNEVPRVTTGATANRVFSDFYVEDASYLTIQNVQLGYTLPQNALEKLGINTLRIYAAVNNLYTFTDYSGFDPHASTGEPIGGGIDYGFYPIPRIYMAGINLNF
ncbi:MAG TPA: SusC/RagA family protein, partial [Salinimicrobium sp.]|nr:SusC/RagA family protein [Salinimicrobium sp.]